MQITRIRLPIRRVSSHRGAVRDCGLQAFSVVQDKMQITRIRLPIRRVSSHRGAVRDCGLQAFFVVQDKMQIALNFLGFAVTETCRNKREYVGQPERNRGRNVPALCQGFPHGEHEVVAQDDQDC